MSPWPGSYRRLALRISSDLAEMLAASPDGASCHQSHHLSSSNPPSSQKPMIYCEYKFGHHSPALSMIHCLSCRVKPKFLSMAWMAFHDPTFQPVSCSYPVFTHIPLIFSHTCSTCPAFKPLYMLFLHQEYPSLIFHWTHTLPNINSGVTFTRKTSRTP